MKKFLFFVFALFCFVGIANAQWDEPQFVEGDELTEKPNQWLYPYYDFDGLIMFSQSLDFTKLPNAICFYTNKSIFDYDDRYAECIIGFYNNDKLIEKITTKVWVSSRGDEAYIFSYPDGTEYPIIIKKIINHLNNVGNVRFIIPTYSAGNFDITVTKNPNLFKK